MIRVSDHALIRFLERAGGMDAEALRDMIASSLARSAAAALALGDHSPTIVADGLIYIVRSGVLVTVVPDSVQARHRAARREEPAP